MLVVVIVIVIIIVLITTHIELRPWEFAQERRRRKERGRRGKLGSGTWLMSGLVFGVCIS